MKEVKSVKDLALEELKNENIKSATAALKELYKQKEAAEKIVRNIDREIEDYLAELDS